MNNEKMGIFIAKKRKEKPVYKKENVSFSNDFDIDIGESGIYTITVTGEKAKGSIRFMVENN